MFPPTFTQIGHFKVGHEFDPQYVHAKNVIWGILKIVKEIAPDKSRYSFGKDLVSDLEYIKITNPFRYLAELRVPCVATVRLVPL